MFTEKLKNIKLINHKTYKNDYLSWPLHHHIRSNTNHSDTKETKKNEIRYKYTHFHNLDTMGLVIMLLFTH